MKKITIIDPKNKNNLWFDFVEYRELFFILTKRDISVRYKQTVIGIAWALIKPLLTMIVFSIIFGKLAKLEDTVSVPYPILVYAGLLPWQLFSAGLSDSSSSLLDNSALITKVYFPRVIFPITSVSVVMIDFFICFLILVGLFFFYGFNPGLKIFLLPLFVLMAFFACLGPGLLFASLNVKYRDVRYALPFLIQIGLYISPVGFSSSIISEEWRLLYSLNPMVGIIDGFRWCLLGDEYILNIRDIGISFFSILLFLFIGLNFFRKTEKNFSDII